MGVDGLSPAPASHEARVFFIAHLARPGLAHVFESRKPPGVREARTLSRLHRLNPAIDPIEKDALPVLLFAQRQPTSVRPQAGPVPNELANVHLEKGGNPIDLRRLDFYLSRPTTAGGAALALIERFHGDSMSA